MTRVTDVLCSNDKINYSQQTIKFIKAKLLFFCYLPIQLLHILFEMRPKVSPAKFPYPLYIY